ncbi:hypothetical protein [Pseudomonas sp.]|uniref:hypothetical protein n=1 Tax=Pseudomonas sp. TaxID=306 RepID=UPI002583E9E1|nr:hypothetical protein [Pseudomonas sp.]
MNKEVFKQYPALVEAYENAPDVQAANGEMLVKLIRGDISEPHEATRFFLGANERMALVEAYVGEQSKDYQKIEILSTVKLKPGRYELKDDASSSVVAFYIYTVKGDPNDTSYYNIGNGVLNVKEFLNDPVRPYIKGTIEFMCKQMPIADTFMKVVAEDFWVKGDLS